MFVSIFAPLSCVRCWFSFGLIVNIDRRSLAHYPGVVCVGGGEGGGRYCSGAHGKFNDYFPPSYQENGYSCLYVFVQYDFLPSFSGNITIFPYVFMPLGSGSGSVIICADSDVPSTSENININHDFFCFVISQ